MPWVGEKMFVKEALAQGLRAWAAEPGLRRIVVSHGDVIDDDPGGVRERIAREPID